MLDAIRTRAQGWIAKVILALIIIPFALWGVDSYLHTDAKSEMVADVGKGGVSRQEYTDALKEQADQMRQQLGQNFDPAVTETQAFREQVINALINQKALEQEAKAAGLEASDAQIAVVLKQIPAFQEDGKFSPDRYNRLLAQQGMSAAYFEHRLRNEIVMRTYQQPMLVSVLTSTTSTDLAAKAAAQRREISWYDITPAMASNGAGVSDAEIQAYYDQHKDTYVEPEMVRVEYLRLSLDDLAKNVQISEKQIQDYFNSNASHLGPPEERSASHILISAPENDVAARKKAREKAESILAEVQKSPKSFAELAKRESQDPGSAAQGGSLGSFPRGAMVKPFDDAVFSMKPGDIRLVESNFGFHIVRLDGIKDSKVTLASVKSQIEADLRRQEAQKLFAEAAENFSNLVYEHADSFKSAVDALKLNVSTSGWIDRHGEPSGILNSPKLLAAIFSPDSIKARQNIDPVEVERDELVSARVIDYRPAKQKPVSEVSDAIKNILRTRKVAAQTESMGQSSLKQLAQGTEPAGIHWSAFEIVGRAQPGKLDQKAIKDVMRMDGGKLPAYMGMSLPDGGYRIIRLTRVLNDGEANPGLRSAIANGMRQAYARADMTALIELAKASQKVVIHSKLIQKQE